MKTTVGQLLINEALPPDLRDYSRPIDKKTIKRLLYAVATQYPNKYNDIAKQLMDIGGEVATAYGNEASISLDSLRIGPKARKLRDDLHNGVTKILATKDTDEHKNTQIVKFIADRAEQVRSTNFAEQLDLRNSMAMQVNSGARGNPTQFSSTNVGDLLVSDHKDNAIPVPILNSYAEGLDPVEYWAGSYGARKGVASTKFATPKGGFLSKQLGLATHRLIVTENDCGTTNGIPVDSEDTDNIGALLAQSASGFGADTVIDSKVSKKLASKGKNIVVRSPITCQAREGICAKCAGVREFGKLPDIGSNIGLTASQALSEPITQSGLSQKHTGGVAGVGATASAFDTINQLVQIPKTFTGGAAIAQIDGTVSGIEKAPQGGSYIVIAGQKHYAAPEFDPVVAPGDKIEAGDIISEGIPNPSELVKYKGIGAGRWHFMNVFRDTLKKNKIEGNRRNIELLARGLINHARVVDADGMSDALPDDIIEFGNLTRGYKPRAGTKKLPIKHAIGMYMESPSLQYSIGTKITPKVSAELQKYGISSVDAHPDTPSFEPEMVRAMETLGYNEDWMVRLGGFHLKKNLLESVHRGLGSKEHSTSYIPSLAKTVEFGKAPPKPGVQPGAEY